MMPSLSVQEALLGAGLVLLVVGLLALLAARGLRRRSDYAAAAKRKSRR